ncbi:MAG: GNAT family N-acetyltransferase [Caldilineaceae bacterium]|jgi:GNAT superfamily N-acetyltransferase
MKFEYAIRPPVIDDAPALAHLLHGLGYFDRLQDVPIEETTASVSAALAKINASDDHTLYVAIGADGRLLGYTAVHWIPDLFLPGPEGYLSELFVVEAARGQGIGGALLDAVTVEAQRRGGSRLQLINFRHRESYRRGFYAKHGWEERPTAAIFTLFLDE